MTERGELGIAIMTFPDGSARVGVRQGDDELETLRFCKALETGGVRLSILEWEPLDNGG